MKWLIHGTYTDALLEALKRHEQEPHLPPELEIAPETSLEALVKIARQKQHEILTTDQTLAVYLGTHGFAPGRCAVYIQVEGGEEEHDDAIDRLFERYRSLSPSRLYTVTANRVKIKQLPQTF